MKKTFFLTLISIVSCCYSFAQLSAVGNSGQAMTAYTNGAANNPIYIWCGQGLSNNQASLSVTPAGGTGPYTFLWYYHDQSNFSWALYNTSTGTSSTISNLPSDGYRVEVKDNNGVIIECYTAWVWNMNGEVTASADSVACNATDLTGTVNVLGNFTYYNPPPPKSPIDANTQISVCFSATHTYVSDLAFYLVGPPGCGSPRITLSPNPGAIGQGSVCNNGDNVNNLCFSNTSGNNLNVCNATTPLTGTYGSYGATPTAINWSPLIGCNAAEGGWTVQIYDCIGADVGSLTNSQISFSNLPPICGSPTTINYNSGPINSAINDNSCSAGTASIFQVPPDVSLTTPITINANVSFIWTSDDQTVVIPGATTDLTPSVIDLEDGTTNFILTATSTYGSATCTYIDGTSFTSACCTVEADAGNDISFCSGASAQIGLPQETGKTYLWSPATGLDNPTAAQPIVTLTNTTATAQTYTYTLIVTNVEGGGCTDTAEMIVTVNPLPQINAGQDVAICIGDSVALTAIGTGTITWDNPVYDGVKFAPTSTATYTANIIDVNGCENSDEVVVTVNPLPVIDAGANKTICLGDPIALAGSGPAGVNYIWSDGIINGQAFQPGLGSHTYSVIATDANGCVNTDEITITVLTVPVSDFSADVNIGNPPLLVNFTNNSSNGNSYSWNYGDGSTSTSFNAPPHTYNFVGTYTVQLEISNGTCSDVSSMVITVIPYPDPIVHIPNVFTPNGDQVNDEFFFDMQYVKSIEIRIFNRWGNKILEMNDINSKWDGKENGNDVSDGVYFYQYTLVDLNGKMTKGHGSVTLAR